MSTGCNRHLRDLIAGGAPTQLRTKTAALLAKVPPRDGVEAERKQMARDLLVGVRRLDRALAQNRRRCVAAVAASSATLTQFAGISDVLAAKILDRIGDIARFPSAGADTGNSRNEALRLLKRQLTKTIYRTLLADADRTRHNAMT